MPVTTAINTDESLPEKIKKHATKTIQTTTNIKVAHEKQRRSVMSCLKFCLCKSLNDLVAASGLSPDTDTSSLILITKGLASDFLFKYRFNQTKRNSWFIG